MDAFSKSTECENHMKVIVTLDRYDGSSSQLKMADLEEIDARSLFYAMMEANVCGITITKDKNLISICEKLND